MDRPIEYSTSPIPAQVISAVRVVLMALGAALTQRGILTSDDIASLEVVLPAAVTVATFAWSQWATRKNAQKLAITGKASPDSVAIPKA